MSQPVAQQGVDNPENARKFKKRELGSWTIAAVLVSTEIGPTILGLPRRISTLAGTAAPMAILLGGLLGFLPLLGLWAVWRYYPELNFFEISKRLFGHTAGVVFNFIPILFYLWYGGLVAREFASIVVSAVLPRTPVEITLLVMLLTTAIAARDDVVGQGRMHLFYLPLLFLPSLLGMLFGLKEAHLSFLQPFLGNAPLRQIPAGSWAFYTTLRGIIIPLIFLPFLAKRKEAIVGLATGQGLVLLYDLLLMIATLAVFGVGELRQLEWPTLEYTKATSLPGSLLERLDSVFLAQWVIAVFTTLLTVYHASAYGLAQSFNLVDHRPLVTSLLPFFYCAAMAPPNLPILYQCITVTNSIGGILALLYPVIYLAVTLLKQRHNRGATQPQSLEIPYRSAVGHDR
ncbi:MAG: endospore germination permease [Firmicutes bacterium]|nr:endospore germination permease [Bacillota bacterium]